MHILLLALTQAQLQLVPQPREIAVLRSQPLPQGIAVTVPANADDRFAVADLLDHLRERGIRTAATGSARIVIRRVALDPAMREEGYVIVPDTVARRLTVQANTAAGVFYALQTIKQLIEGSGAGATIHFARVRDWPAMRWRGVHDDVSRGPFPTLEFQKKQIRTFAAYKINTYSPYFEHTLQFASHPIVAPPGGSMSREDVRELVAYARRYHIQVIPEQQTFGHLHHLLKWELYGATGETQRGHVLAPDQPRSLEIVKETFAEIDSLFPGRFLHIGADETFELGRGQTAERVRTEGIGPVYLGYLTRVANALAPTGKQLLFWGDVAQNHPELVGSLPKNLSAVAWGYGARPSFDNQITPYRNAGIETWIAPGVSNWNRVYPDNDVALRNIQRFVADGQRLGAVGVLNTSWDDDGDALFNQTWYGILFGASAGWQPGEADTAAFARAYGRVFHDDATGSIDAAQQKLAAAHARLRPAGGASTYLFWLDPWSAEGQVASRQVLPLASDVRVLAESALVHVARARAATPRLRERDALDALELGARRIDFLAAKFQFADEVARMYARAESLAADTGAAARSGAGRELSDISGINGRLQDLRDGFATLRQLYEDAWLRENHPYWRHNVLARFDLSTQLWIQRMDVVQAARREWQRSRKLPSATAVGIPAAVP